MTSCQSVNKRVWVMHGQEKNWKEIWASTYWRAKQRGQGLQGRYVPGSVSDMPSWFLMLVHGTSTRETYKIKLWVCSVYILTKTSNKIGFHYKKGVGVGKVSISQKMASALALVLSIRSLFQLLNPLQTY